MKNYNNRLEEGRIIVYILVSLFSRDAISKCLYWYGDKFTAQVNVINNEAYQIDLKPIKALDEVELQNYYLKLQRDLIDFNLRDIVTKETQNIRELLVAKAFSNGEFDEDPVGEVSDPVGFTPII